MQSAGIGIVWPWILGLSLLALLGLFLLWRGLYPRRVGTTPYCRKCRYNLTGTDRRAEAARCPECGADVTADLAVVFGERVRRWGRVAVGAALLLLSVGPLLAIAVATVRGVNWYQVKPTFLVIQDLESSNPMVARRACPELRRRASSGKLSAAQIARIAEIGLREQTRPKIRTVVSQERIDLLGALYGTGALSPEYTQRLFANAVRFDELELRPTVVRGRAFPVICSCETRLPRGSLWASVELQPGIANVHLLPNALVRGPSTARGWMQTRPGVQIDEVGEHEITVEADVALYAGPPVGGRIPVDHRVHTLTGTVEVLAEEPVDYIKLVSTPELDAAVPGLLWIDRVRTFAGYWEGGPTRLSITMCFKPRLPIGLAFDVLTELNGREHLLGRVTAPKGAEYATKLDVSEQLAEPIPEQVTIRLRASKEAAERTTDLFEIWGGEVVFENVRPRPDPYWERTLKGLRTTP